MENKEAVIFSVAIFLILILGAVFLIGAPSRDRDNLANENVSELPLSDVLSYDEESTSSLENLGEFNQIQKENSMLNPEINYKAVLTTNKGVLTIDLLEDTPVTTANFIKLSSEGFYDGVRFHRIIKDFMVQTGDPLSKDPEAVDSWGTGSPGYRFADEPFSGEYVRGTVAMANSGPNTNGSQFFIMTKEFALPRAYVIFGKLENEESFTTLEAIANTPVGLGANSSEASFPLEDVIIEKVEIIEEAF